MLQVIASTAPAYIEANAQPMVMYRNLLAEGTITSATLPTTAPRANAVTESTFDYWQPDTLPQLLIATLATSEAADGAFFAAHTLGSTGARISIRYDGPTRTNLVLRSEELDNATWVKTEATITANSGVAPDGSTTADKIVASVNNLDHRVRQTFAGITSGQTYTFSCFLKADGYGWGQIAIGGTFGSTYVFVNLATGAVGLNVGVTGITVTDFGSGWWRVSGSAAATSTGSGVLDVFVRNANSFTTFAGDGTSGILAWGAQVELGTAVTSYIPTTTAAVASGLQDYITWFAPESDAPFGFIWPSFSSTRWVVVISGAAAQIGVAWIGPRLVIPGGVLPDYVPIWGSRRITKYSGVSRRGQFFGQRIERAGARLTPGFMDVPYSFALTDLADFRDHYNEGKAFVWASAPSVFPEDAAYVWASDDEVLRSPIRAGGDWCGLSMDIEAYIE